MFNKFKKNLQENYFFYLLGFLYLSKLNSGFFSGRFLANDHTSATTVTFFPLELTLAFFKKTELGTVLRAKSTHASREFAV